MTQTRLGIRKRGCTCQICRLARTGSRKGVQQEGRSLNSKVQKRTWQQQLHFSLPNRINNAWTCSFLWQNFGGKPSRFHVCCSLIGIGIPWKWPIEQSEGNILLCKQWHRPGLCLQKDWRGSMQLQLLKGLDTLVFPGQIMSFHAPYLVCHDSLLVRASLTISRRGSELWWYWQIPQQ